MVNMLFPEYSSPFHNLFIYFFVVLFRYDFIPDFICFLTRLFLNVRLFCKYPSANEISKIYAQRMLI